MNFGLSLTIFDVVFPLGLGAIFGLTRYMKFMQAGVADAGKLAVIDGVKGMFGAGVIMLGYKLLGIL